MSRGNNITPAWSTTDLKDDPHARSDKPERVRRMFGAIAHRYDLNNRLHSLWRDQAWRRHAVRSARVSPGDLVLDVACGTGDLTQAFARSPAAHVVGLDFTPQMLEIARAKRRRLAPAAADKIEYVEGDAMALPFPDASFDVVSIAFGIRNVAEPTRAIAEFARVLRPGGRLVVLEFERPRAPLIGWFNDLYCARIMPITATLISGDQSGAYRYLPRSVDTFLTRERLLAAFHEAGLCDGRARSLTLGICVCSTAAKP